MHQFHAKGLAQRRKEREEEVPLDIVKGKLMHYRRMGNEFIRSRTSSKDHSVYIDTYSFWWKNGIVYF